MNRWLQSIFLWLPFAFTAFAHVPRSTLELTPGAHQLTAQAKHPSGLFTTNATIWFTNNVSAPDRIEVTYDPAGQVTKRLWRSANGTTNRTQTLTWDARGRLYRVVERDAQTNGFDWSAAYDAFGRRLWTTEVPVTNNVSVTSQTLTLSQYYDPEVEFMELGVSVNGATTWKIFGPDLNGTYGGLNGLGGFDAIVPGPELFCPTIGDARGNILAVYDVTHGSLAWNASRPTGYGAAPSYRPPPLGRGANIIQASAWRGRWMDVIGSYQIGLRPYLSENGSWTSPDSLGHDGSDNLFSFAEGDPINRWDSDGRVGRATFQLMQDLGSTVGHLASDAYYSVGYAGMYPFSPETAEQYYGASARNLANTALGLGQTAYDAAAYPSFEMFSTFMPEEAANAYGPSLERLSHVADAMTGGEGNSATYQTTYTLLNAAAMVLGGEFGQAGRVGRFGEVGETIAAAERAFVSSGEILGPEGAGQFVFRPGLGSQETAGVVRSGEFVNRVFDSGYAPGAEVSGPLGRSFAPGSGVPTTAAQAIQERGLNTFYPNNAQQAVVYRATQNIPATLRTSIGGTMPEVLINPANFSSLQRVNSFPVVKMGK